jgi:hypothetical protein
MTKRPKTTPPTTPTKRRPRPVKPDRADTLAAAAARLGVDVTLLRSLRSSGSRAFDHGRVNIDLVRSELDALPAPDIVDGLEEKGILERRKLRAQYQAAEFNLAVARRDYLLAADVANDMRRISNATRAECLRLVGDAPTWAGLTAAEISARATEWMTSVCLNLSDETSKLYR